MMLKKNSPLLFPLTLVVYEIICYLSNDMYLPALPEMMRYFHMSTSESQLTLTWWFLGLATAPLFLGVLSDQHGRRPVLLWGGAAYCFFTLLCVLSIPAWLFMVARFMQGAMVASMFVAGYAVIHESFDHKESVKILALMASISVLAPAVGPLIGGFVLLVAHWKMIFILIAVAGAASLISLYGVMPETLPPAKRTPFDWQSTKINYAAVLKNGRFMSLMMILGCNLSAFLVWVAASSLLMIDTFHFSPIGYGLVQCTVFVANIFGNAMVKKWIDFLPLSLIIYTGLILAVFGSVLALMLGLTNANAWLMFVFCMGVFAFGSGMIYAPLNRSIIEMSDAPMGVRMSVFTALLMISFSSGSVFAGLFFDGSIFSLSWMLSVLGMISLFMFIAFMKISGLPVYDSQLGQTLRNGA